jgi:hypothetical protein
LTLTDSPRGLSFAAGLDPRQSLANDLAVAIERGDISQMSVGFQVDPAGDTWNSDFSSRIISKISVLFDVSAVTFPASPTTEIFLDELPDVGGPDGTEGGGGGSPDAGIADGTGSRSAVSIQIDQDMLRLARPPLEGARSTKTTRPTHAERMIQLDQDLLRLARPPALV